VEQLKKAQQAKKDAEAISDENDREEELEKATAILDEKTEELKEA